MNDQNEISHQKMSKVMINDRERPGNVRQSSKNRGINTGKRTEEEKI